MDLSISKEPLYLNEVIYDGTAEQGVEFDYILPDYYPDIFKILKCSLKPGIVSYNISGDKLICDGIVYISALYLSENSNNLNCVEHRYTFSKTIDLSKEAEGASATIIPKTDYCTVRAISGRRLDVRGAISCKVKVTNSRMTEIISGAKGNGVQVKNTPVPCGGKKITVKKQFIAREDIEVSEARGTVKSVVSCDTVSSVSDCKVIEDKVILKGEVKLKALYLIENDGEVSTEIMEADIPLSQIIDAEGITDKHSSYAQFNILSCDLSLKQTGESESRIFTCDISAEASVLANIEQTVYPVTDMYSTDYESEFTTASIRTETNPRYISQTLTLKETAECTQGAPQSVIDARCELNNLTCRGKSSEELVVCGQASYQVLARLESGQPVFIEKVQPFELSVQVSGLNEDSSIDPFLQVASVSYSITSESEIELRVSISMQGVLYQTGSIEVVKEININTEAPKKKNNEYSLKLYFAEENEDVWSIAKQYNTDCEQIRAENDIEGDTVPAGMLLIPIV
ncbi:MAG: DUF3794 domain-containing protein [Eubacterium sp.]|nr:DUF3794 domain-containing protein [Eubacterium sp.]